MLCYAVPYVQCPVLRCLSRCAVLCRAVPYVPCPMSCVLCPPDLQQADFAQIDTLGLQVHEEARQYDIATCMFAMHYFFDRKESLQCLLQTIAANLREGELVLWSRGKEWRPGREAREKTGVWGGSRKRSSS